MLRCGICLGPAVVDNGRYLCAHHGEVPVVADLEGGEAEIVGLRAALAIHLPYRGEEDALARGEHSQRGRVSLRRWLGLP